MNQEILCGSSCVKYILSYFNKKINIKYNMTWITELAIELRNNGITNLKLYSYNSNLYNDYLKYKDTNYDFEGFYYLDKLIKNNIELSEVKLNKKELLKEIDSSDFIILCVESKKFNLDSNMSGGHFIIISGLKDNKITVINPIKNNYEKIECDIDFVIHCCKEYGSWRILIKEDTND